MDKWWGSGGRNPVNSVCCERHTYKKPGVVWPHVYTEPQCCEEVMLGGLLGIWFSDLTHHTCAAQTSAHGPSHWRIYATHYQRKNK